MITAIAVYLGLCLIISVIGFNRKFGFWGYFFCSLFLTPFIGALVLLASDKRPKQHKICPKCHCPLSEQKVEKRVPDQQEAVS